VYFDWITTIIAPISVHGTLKREILTMNFNWPDPEMLIGRWSKSHTLHSMADLLATIIEKGEFNVAEILNPNAQEEIGLFRLKPWLCIDTTTVDKVICVFNSALHSVVWSDLDAQRLANLGGLQQSMIIRPLKKPCLIARMSFQDFLVARGISEGKHTE
jgi:hypothetical protein